MGARQRRESYRRTVEALAVEGHCRGGVYSRVLDFGCGTGWFARRFRQQGSEVVGLEVTKNALTEARNRAGGSGVLWVWYGGGAIPLRSASMDLVLAVGVVRSLLDRGPLHEAVGEWRRCLRTGGRLLLIETDNRAMRRYMAAEILRHRIVQMGFECLSWYPVRKVSWAGIAMVKLGLVPRSHYGTLARWELWARRRTPWSRGKRAFLGEFVKQPSSDDHVWR
jgi:SAM-dependent methyltransferase